MSFYQTYEDPAYYDLDNYELRVQMLEEQGLTRSDAQGVVDAEILSEEVNG
jgi:hypothetical protein